MKIKRSFIDLFILYHKHVKARRTGTSAKFRLQRAAASFLFIDGAAYAAMSFAGVDAKETWNFG